MVVGAGDILRNERFPCRQWPPVHGANRAVFYLWVKTKNRGGIVSNPIESKIELQTKRGGKWATIIEWSLAEMVQATAKFEELKGKRRKHRLVHVTVNLLATNETEGI